MDGTADQSHLARSLVHGWADAFAEAEQRLAPHFARSEARQRALAYLQGLLGPAERKNSWQLAESVGDASPYGFQHLLGRADWDADAVRDELHAYVRAYLGDPNAIVVLDETGFLKKGRMSAGVARQYSGTAGRIENAQIGVFLTYTSRAGHTLVDRELYLPKEWTDDLARCRQAGIPSTQPFHTKPALARQMLARLFDHKVPMQWVTGDSVYGDDRRLRVWLEARQQAYVLGVSGKTWLGIGWRHVRVKTLLAQLPGEGWMRLSAGSGAKGLREYDWLRLPLGTGLHDAGQRWLLVRRKLDAPHELTAYVVYAPQGSSLEACVQVAGTRWTVEQDFETTKGEVGLDQYEVRSWTGWYRHITLALWAQAILTVIRAAAIEAELPKKGRQQAPPPSSLARFKAQRGL